MLLCSRQNADPGISRSTKPTYNSQILSPTPNNATVQDFVGAREQHMRANGGSAVLFVAVVVAAIRNSGSGRVRMWIECVWWDFGTCVVCGTLFGMQTVCSMGCWNQQTAPKAGEALPRVKTDDRLRV